MLRSQLKGYSNVTSEKTTQTLTPESGSKATLSTSTIQSGKWFGNRPGPAESTALGAIGKTLVGAIVGALFYAWGAHTLAIVIWVIAGLIGVVTLSSQKARTGVGRFFGAIGRGLGWILGVVLLTPLYLVGFTLVRVVGRLAGRDPLYLHDKTSQTFWLPSDQDTRKVRHIHALYATEVASPGRGWGVIALVSLAGLLVASELVLRALGFGNSILYQPDAKVGYYPAPNQEEHRYGGFIKTNSHGMRAPDFEVTKKPGTLRILMLGDSTLYGGSYINQPELYARLLDDALDTQTKVNDVEVLNMAANGWGPFNELGFIEKFGTFGADVAVIALPIGDIYRPLAQLDGVPFFSVNEPPRLALEEVVHHLNWRSRQMARAPQSPEERAKLAEQGIAAYVELAEKLKASGSEVLFEVLPSEPAGTGDKAPESEQKDVDALRAALEPLGFKVGYPVGLFAEQKDSGEIYRDRVHLEGDGHRIYADYLKSRLTAESEKIRAHTAGGSQGAATENGQ